MALFKSLTRSNVDENEIIKKVKNKKDSQPTLKLGKDSLLTIISNIKTTVESRLGKYKDKYHLINTKEELDKYIDKILENGICALDTETTGLNCFKDKIVGASLYTPGQKAIYIPLSHISYITNDLVSSNMGLNDFKSCLNRLSNESLKVIYHNAKFDYKMIYNNFGIKLPIYYDTLLTARALNQKESANLKYQYAKYIENSDEFSKFSDLFDNIPFQYVPINCGYIYASKDAEMTYQLYEYQSKILETQPKVKWLMENIEFPCIKATIELELNGVLIDQEYAKFLHNKYQKL